MVKLLEEFPGIHQTFNLVPSLIVQLEEYASGGAKDRLLDITQKPAEDLSREEKETAIPYLFQVQ